MRSDKMQDIVVSIGIVLVILLLVGTVMFFGFASVRTSTSVVHTTSSRRGLCINNLRLIHHAKEVLAIKDNLTNGQVLASTPTGIWARIDVYIDGTNILHCQQCPAGTHYNYGAIDEAPTCPFGGTHVYAVVP